MPEDKEYDAGPFWAVAKDIGDNRHKAAVFMEENFTLLKDATTTPGYTYYGEAQPGTATTAAAWRISRNGPDGLKWLNGSDMFANQWNAGVYAGAAVYS